VQVLQLELLQPESLLVQLRPLERLHQLELLLAL
jgi:hypothetical protein